MNKQIDISAWITKTFESLSRLESQEKVICYGTFDTIHPGHISYFKYAKSCGEVLIILVNDDPNAVYSLEERIANLDTCNLVDFILPANLSNLSKIIEVSNPRYFIVGEEFKNNRSKEIDSYIAHINDGRIEVKYYSAIFYQSLLREKIDNSHIDDNFNIDRLKQVLREKKVEKEELINIVERFEHANIGVYGDVIVDRYITGNVIGVSSEAPVMVFHEQDVMDFLGGAGVVAAHCAELGANSELYTVVGSDQEGQWAVAEAERLRIDAKVIVDPLRPTTLKTRFVSGEQKLFRSSRLLDEKLSEGILEELMLCIDSRLSNLKGLIISDFSYGVVNDLLLHQIKRKGIPDNLIVTGDSQTSSQRGDLKKFEGIDSIFPTELEAREDLRDHTSTIEIIGTKLLDKMCVKNVYLKLGKDGMLRFSRDLAGNVTRNHTPAFGHKAVDLAGAGDTMLAAINVGRLITNNMKALDIIGSVASAIAISTLGNKPVKHEYITKVLQKL